MRNNIILLNKYQSKFTLLFKIYYLFLLNILFFIICTFIILFGHNYSCATFAHTYLYLKYHILYFQTDILIAGNYCAATYESMNNEWKGWQISGIKYQQKCKGKLKKSESFKTKLLRRKTWRIRLLKLINGFVLA